MIYEIKAPATIQTSVRLPASKSISNRALILNALSKSRYPIDNLSDSDDTYVLRQALSADADQVDIGAAGTAMRFLTAFFAQSDGDRLLTGTPRMKQRPIAILVDALRELGANIRYTEKEGFPPLHIHGQKLSGGEICLNGGVSSQYISALMMIAPCLRQGLSLHLESNIVSRPYIRMTAGLMAIFGVKTDWHDNVIRIAPQSYTPVPFRVESDWSAASYWYEIQSLMPHAQVDLQGLEKDSLQGDAQTPIIFSAMAQAKNSFIYDFTDVPDLAQTLVVTCCLTGKTFRFSGLQSLRIKETDRMTALQNELKKLGYLIHIESDSELSWKGEHCEASLQPATIATYEDHRMAMAFAPACLKTGAVRIADPQVVSKSYPHYWDDLRAAGFKITEIA
ncbi:MAG: 3-phosphoshikimate 1-carboxyvinyltransferase [Candidatus Symbiothrix sp.]|jgi:3-phosphoshikimate 1-carboxyvinyltransferase|nr:3-phosphoshikimate 1-carboxyvinyltransferase [Candidatus Symbiothrix sp.]